MEKYVPCLCYLCNGKLVSRYVRRKHAIVCSSTNQEQPDGGLPMSRKHERERAGDKHQHEQEDEQCDSTSEHRDSTSEHRSDEEEVCLTTLLVMFST